MKEGNYPLYLYHYTTVETLDLILQNKSIRFSSLENVDDISEPVFNGKAYGKYFFVSCWTGSEVESIPMWNMYSQDMTGVRIKLPSMPFRSYDVPRELQIGENTLVNESQQSIIPAADIIGEDYLIFNILRLTKVKYDEKSVVDKLRGHDLLVQSDRELVTFQVDKICGLKYIDWGFQCEWRFNIQVLPILKEELYGQDFSQKLISNVSNLREISIGSYDMKIDDNAYHSMEITVGPKGDLQKINELVKRYSSNIKVEESKLVGTIR